MKKNWIVSSALFLVVGAVALHFYAIQGKERDIRDIRKIPLQIGEWKARDIAVTEHEYDILETRNLIVREYKNKKGESIHLFIIYSETNRRVCHPPVVCLIGSGITVTNATKEKLVIGGRAFTVNRLLARGAKSEEVLLYWYMLGKEFTEDYLTQQFRWVTGQATGKGLGGAMVRIIAPISGSEEETLKRAKQFIQELLPILTGEEKV